MFAYSELPRQGERVRSPPESKRRVSLARQIGRRLRELREEQGVTQEKLAYECGRSKSFLSEIEAGKKLPSLSTLADFAARLGVRPFDLLVFPEVGVRERLTDRVRTLSIEEVEAVERFLSER